MNKRDFWEEMEIDEEVQEEELEELVKEGEHSCPTCRHFPPEKHVKNTCYHHSRNDPAKDCPEWEANL